MARVGELGKRFRVASKEAIPFAQALAAVSPSMRCRADARKKKMLRQIRYLPEHQSRRASHRSYPSHRHTGQDAEAK
jgi:hypothetical protein